MKMVNFSARFKSLPISARRLLGLGAILGLFIALPLFVWAIVTQTFLFTKKAASGEPIPTNNPISWTTPYVSLSASNFYISIGGTNIFLGNSNVAIHSDPGSDTYTSLEASWQENGVPMRLFIYFNKDPNGQWNVTEMRTYNGSPSGDWLYYNGFAGLTGSTPLTFANITFTSKDGSGVIHFENLNLRPFIPISIPPSPYGYILEPKPLDTVQMQYFGPNSGAGYGLNAVLRDANFKVITNQSNFSYQWSSTNTNVVTVTSDLAGDSNSCFYGIQTPCPNAHGNLVATGAGVATIKVDVIRKTDGVVVATANFPVVVTQGTYTPTPSPVGTPNTNPPICLQSSIPPPTGNAPLSVMLFGAGGAGDGPGLNGYQWDFTNDGAWDTGVSIDPVIHVYDQPGTYHPVYRIQGANNVWSAVCNYPYPIVVGSGSPSPTATPIACQQAIDDDFGGTGQSGVPDPAIWESASNVAVATDSGTLIMYGDPGVDSSYALHTLHAVSGDFQMTADVTRFDATPTNINDLATAELKAYSDDNNFFTVRWVKWQDITGVHSQVNLYAETAGQIVQGQGVNMASNATPTLKLVRLGGQTKGYYDIGNGFQELPAITSSVFSGPVKPTLFIYKQGSAGTHVEFDNFRMGCITSTPGDVNGDGRVNIVDIGIIIDNYRVSPIVNPAADLNNDGIVNIVDIGIVVDNYQF